MILRINRFTRLRAYSYAHTATRTQPRARSHTHAATRTQLRTRSCAHAAAHMQLCRCSSTHTAMHIQLCTHSYVHIAMHTQLCTRSYAHAAMHTQLCTCSYAHTATHIKPLVLLNKAVILSLFVNDTRRYLQINCENIVQFPVNLYIILIAFHKKLFLLILLQKKTSFTLTEIK